jgi:hypothetical protein
MTGRLGGRRAEGSLLPGVDTRWLDGGGAPTNLERGGNRESGCQRSPERSEGEAKPTRVKVSRSRPRSGAMVRNALEARQPATADEGQEGGGEDQATTTNWRACAMDFPKRRKP